MKRLFKYFKSEDGVAATEFAFVAPILVYIMMGIVDFGLYINNQMRMENASRAAVDYILSGGDVDDVQTVVLAQNFNVEEMDDEGNPVLPFTVSTDESCECADGESISCSDDETCDAGYKRHFFEIELEQEYSTVFPYPGIPETISLAGTARLQTQ